ncbi:MAG: hypothetical protein CSA35_04510 [Dethiosulfovibrio peptidovorans]|nr:MAG: hypothetical protein CSA35_04510 [Dethiosulfovibrio peptidovorans]
MRRRPPVDWDKELQKTKRIQRRGWGISALSLIFAGAVIGGVSVYQPDVSVSRFFLPAIAVGFALALVIFVLRRRRR